MKVIKITSEEKGGVKSVTLDIEGTIGGEFDWTTGQFNGATKEAIKAELREIADIKADKIIININSYGGDVNHGLSIHDLLAQSKAKKEVRINGMTASAATIIAMAGDEISMSENALFLAHRSSTFAMGNVNDIEMVKQDLEKIDGLMVNIYKKKTGKTDSEILSMMDENSGRGKWLDADEAKEFGFIDTIFEPKKIAALATPDQLAKLGYPKINPNQNSMKTEFMKKMDGLFSAIANKLKINDEGATAEVKEVETEDGTTLKIDMAGEEVAIGDSVTDGDGNATPDKSYTLTDGTTITTDSESKVSEVKKKEEEEEDGGGEEAMTQEQIDGIVAENTDLKNQITALKAANKQAKADMEAVEERVKKFSKLVYSAQDIPGDKPRFRERSPETAPDAKAVQEARRDARKAKLDKVKEKTN
jgi:ATP-dependent Clp protease, protease subunit